MASCGEEQTESPDDRGIRQYVEAYCEVMFSCDCTERSFSTPAACQDVMYRPLRLGQLAARAAGLSWDEDCLQAHIENVEQTACEKAPLTRQWCSYLHGDKVEGEPCTSYNSAGTGMNDCAQGLLCFGRCYNPDDPDPAFLLDEGASCFQQGDGPLGVCGEGLTCHLDTYRCTRLSELGEACSHPRLCTEGYCDGGVCVPPKAEGEACNEWYECGSGLLCTEQACRPYADAPICEGAIY